MARIKVQISVDEELLSLVDQYADDNFTNRSGVFCQGAASVINQSVLIHAIQDMSLAMRKIADEGSVDENTMKELEDFERIAKMFGGK